MAISFGDASVLPAADAVPTPDVWGVREHTFTGTLNLLDTDKTVQILDGSSTPVVNLPTSTVDNPFFVLINAGIEEFLVGMPTSGRSFTLAVGEGVQVFSDGSVEWYGSPDNLKTQTGLAVLHYGGRCYTIGGNPYGPPAGYWVDTQITQITTTETVTSWSMPVSGRLVGFACRYQTSVIFSLKIYKNGILSESKTELASTTSRYYGDEFFTTFVAGDRLSVANSGTVSTGEGGYQYFVELYGIDAVLDFTSIMSTSYRWPIVNTPYTLQGSSTYVTYNCDHIVPIALTMRGVSYDLQNAGVHVFEIVKNGTDSGVTFTTDALLKVGTAPLSGALSFAAGDRIALHLTSATNPNQSRVTCLFAATPTKFYRWGGAAGSASYYYMPFAYPSRSISNSAIGYRTSIYMPVAGTVVALAHTRRYTGTLGVQLYKNGMLSEVVTTVTAPGGVDSSMSTTVVPGDYLDVKHPASGTSPGASSIIVAIR